ncbi:hypothetical protein GGE67_002294 [Rhizobium leucaenae]|nr:hypothetical protein [Rhizobium leucaenae]
MSKPLREEFFYQYKRLIAGLKKYGYLEAATIHAKNRQRLVAELSLLD